MISSIRTPIQTLCMRGSEQKQSKHLSGFLHLVNLLLTKIDHQVNVFCFYNFNNLRTMKLLTFIRPWPKHLDK